MKAIQSEVGPRGMDAARFAPEHVQRSSAQLYERDTAMWVAEQVRELRLLAAPNLDTEHIIEELESLTARDRRELRNRITTVLEHLMKLDLAPNDGAVRGWGVTVERTALDIAELLEDSPSLRTHMTEAMWYKAFISARAAAAAALNREVAELPDAMRAHYIVLVEQRISRSDSSSA